MPRTLWHLIVHQWQLTQNPFGPGFAFPACFSQMVGLKYSTTTAHFKSTVRNNQMWKAGVHIQPMLLRLLYHLLSCKNKHDFSFRIQIGTITLEILVLITPVAILNFAFAWLEKEKTASYINRIYIGHYISYLRHTVISFKLSYKCNTANLHHWRVSFPKRL